MQSRIAIEAIRIRRVFRAAQGILGRSEKEVVAVDDVSLAVTEGELLGLLGPNGAGKTTTIKIFTTLLLPTSGSVRVLGRDVVEHSAKVRSQIGFVLGGERGLYWRLSGRDNLRYFAELYGVDPAVSKRRIPELLEMVGLRDRGDERVEGYSRGMKQRLHIARALIHDPKILFLDEPTMGLDPVAARELRGAISGLLSAGKTILLTTHYMFEAEALCRRIAVINRGRIIAIDSPEGLKRHVSDLTVVELELHGAETSYLERLRALSGVEALSIEEQDGTQRVFVQTALGAVAVPSIVEALSGHGNLVKVLVREPTLEDAYVRLVSGEEATG